MNWKAAIPAVLIAGSLGVPHAAEAGDEGWAALGGFLGGVLISQGHHHEYRTGTRHKVYYDEPASHGHYEYRTQRIWHSGQYVHRRQKCGTVRRLWEPGYYSLERVKVWVPAVRASYRSSHRSGPKEYNAHRRLLRSCHEGYTE